MFKFNEGKIQLNATNAAMYAHMVKKEIIEFIDNVLYARYTIKKLGFKK